MQNCRSATVLTGDFEDLSESSICLNCWSLPALRRLPWEPPCSGRPVPSSPVLLASSSFAASAILPAHGRGKVIRNWDRCTLLESGDRDGRTAAAGGTSDVALGTSGAMCAVSQEGRQRRQRMCLQPEDGGGGGGGCAGRREGGGGGGGEVRGGGEGGAAARGDEGDAGRRGMTG